MKRILSFLLAALDALLVFLGCFARYDATAGEALAQTPFSAGSSLGLFASSADLTLPFNAVCRLFGGSDRDHALVFRFGNEPTYFEWIALKTVWTGDAEYVGGVKVVFSPSGSSADKIIEKLAYEGREHECEVMVVTIQ